MEYKKAPKFDTQQELYSLNWEESAGDDGLDINNVSTATVIVYNWGIHWTYSV